MLTLVRTAGEARSIAGSTRHAGTSSCRDGTAKERK